MVPFSMLRTMVTQQRLRVIVCSATVTISRATCASGSVSRRCFGIGRMLDLGGMPSAANDQTLVRTVNASKNSKLQAVAFDFEILTRSIEAAEMNSATTTTITLANNANSNNTIEEKKNQTRVVQEPVKMLNIPNMDIRAKYASKLRGGLPGLELAKSQVESALQRGDAPGHLSARKKAMSEIAASPTKWMAMTGTGKLLSYLTHRSIRIALLPNPNWINDDAKDKQVELMEQFKRQLKDVVIDSIVKIGDSTLEKALEKSVLNEFDIHASRVLVVSDHDQYLKAARDLGMITCRIRPPNARRGNVTTHFSATSVPQVEEVVNEINGISFNAVLNR